MKTTPISSSSNKTAELTVQVERLWTNTWLLVGILFLVVLFSRVLFKSQVLYHWDSVNFAYAITEFDMAKEQPHAPGYIGYVWLTRLVDMFFHNAQNTMVTISIISSGLSVVALFFLGQAMFSRAAGFIAALFLASSPLFWFYGEIALPHTLDTFLVITAVWWLYETMRGDHRYLYPAIIMLAIAGGIRPQTLVFLAPLTLYALRSVGWRKFITAGVLGAVVCLIWFIPLVTLNGGVSRYFEIMGAFGSRFQDTTSVLMGAGWPGVQRNLIKLSLYTVYAWGVALLPAMAYGGYRLYKQDWPQNWQKTIFLAAWVMPVFLFYLLIHMGQQGLVFVFLPALLLVSAEALVRLFSGRYYWLAAAFAAILLFHVAVFTLLPEHPMGPNGQRLLTWQTIRNNDNYFQSRLAAIEQKFPADSTVILATNWHHLEYYLPEYRFIPFAVTAKWEIEEQGLTGGNVGKTIAAEDLEVQSNNQTEALVIIFDPQLEHFNTSSDLMEQLSLTDGSHLSYIRLKQNDEIFFNKNSYGFSLN